MAVIGMSDMAVLDTGMPVDSFDVLVLAGPMKGGNGAADWQRWHAFSSMLASICPGSVIVNQDCTGWAPDRLIFKPQQLVLASYDNLPEAVCRALAQSRS